LVLSTITTAACLDAEQPQPSPAAAPTNDASRIDTGDLVTYDRSELTTQVDEQDAVAAHSNCGQIVFCRDSFGRPEYQCFTGSGCNLTQWQADAQSDCDFVCGASACKSFDILNFSQCSHSI
jgi:hypothetical protein